MGIEANFDLQAVRKYVESKKDAFVEAALEAYKLTCIAMVKRAKETDTYKDQTHKLRSSIGCVLYHDGVEVFNYFESTGGEMGGEGVQEGLAHARLVAEQQVDKTIVAVVVAGADYALYVESNGFDVLTGSTYGFSSDLKREFKDIMDAFSDNVREHFNIK